MPWVSNYTVEPISVSITSNGSDATSFTVKPAIVYSTTAGATAETSNNNYWTRKGAETLKAVVGKKEVKFAVQKDDHVIIYDNSYEIFPAKFGWF